MKSRTHSGSKLPTIESLSDLASLLHFEPKEIKQFINRNSSFYLIYELNKPSGGHRKIMQPNKSMKAIQAWVLRNILDRIDPSEHSMAYRKGLSVIDNANRHKNHRYYLTLDLQEFFPSITFARVRGFFEYVGYSREVSRMLGNLCTCNGLLPQGGVSSPAISNLIASKMDHRIWGYASRRNFQYTRYADDLVISSNDPARLYRSEGTVRKIIHDENFTVNEAKVRRVGPGQKCVVVGLVKNSAEGCFGVGRKKRRAMRAIIHQLATAGSVDSRYDTEEKIRGWITWHKSVDQSAGTKMEEYFHNQFG